MQPISNLLRRWAEWASRPQGPDLCEICVLVGHVVSLSERMSRGPATWHTEVRNKELTTWFELCDD